MLISTGTRKCNRMRLNSETSNSSSDTHCFSSDFTCIVWHLMKTLCHRGLALIGSPRPAIRNVIVDRGSSLECPWQALNLASPLASLLVKSIASCPSMTTWSRWPPSSPKSPSNQCPIRCKHVRTSSGSYLLIRSLPPAHNRRKRISLFFCPLYRQ